MINIMAKNTFLLTPISFVFCIFLLFSCCSAKILIKSLGTDKPQRDGPLVPPPPISSPDNPQRAGPLAPPPPKISPDNLPSFLSLINDASEGNSGVDIDKPQRDGPLAPPPPISSPDNPQRAGSLAPPPPKSSLGNPPSFLSLINNAGEDNDGVGIEKSHMTKSAIVH
ncbi:hypothetical protein P3S67_029906 [Capsicum chacoense]